MIRLAAAAFVLIAIAVVPGAGITEAGDYGWGSAQFWGKACLETECGGPAIGQTVVAKVGDVECGQDVTLHPHSDGEEYSGYAMDVLTDGQKPGCAETGDTVQFFIGDEPALPTVTWELGSHRVDINTGPRFANFHGWLTCDGEPCIPFEVDFQIAPRVDAYIDGVLCGSHQMSGWLITSYYDVNVKSAEAEPGCGTQGANVTFTVDGVPANETAPWNVGSNDVPLSTDADWPFPYINVSFTNNTGVTANGIEVYVYPATNFDPLTDYPVDCGLPTYEYVNYPYDPVIVTWPTACIDAGESVSFMFGVDCAQCPTPGVDHHTWLTPDDADKIWGDVDCSGEINPIDSLYALFADAGIAHPAVVTDCPWYDQSVTLEGGVVLLWSDIDCSGEASPLDALRLLKFDAGEVVIALPPCPEIGAAVVLTDQ